MRQAAVIARKDPAGHNQLIGYLVPADRAIEGQAIRAWLAERLPDHMLPAALAWLPELPLTPNGKLDRRALPRVDLAAERSADYVAPEDDIGRALQAAWQAVLEQAPIGLHDDLFALGGHSLLALRLVHACQQALHAIGHGDAAERIALRRLLAQPTIAGMMASLSSPTAAPGRVVPLRTGGEAPPVFCIHPQSGTVWCFAALAQHLEAGVPVYGLQALGLNAGETPLQDMAEMARSAISAMREVQPRGPYRLVGYSSGGVLAYEMARQLREAGEAVSLLALLDSPLPDGRDTREPTEAETLADAGRLFGLTDPADWPTNAAELRALMQLAGLADEQFDEADAQRLIDTALGIVRAARRHVAAPSDQPLLQIRALQRDTPPDDWCALSTTGRVTTHDLPTDHVGLVGAYWAATVAAHINDRLRALP